MTLAAIPRISLGSWPTPLERAPDLGALLGNPDLWIKRDDLSGFSWGGNKVRAAEFLLADALAQGATELVLAGGPSSNFAAIMAAAGKSIGIDVHQVSYGCEPEGPVAALAASREAGAQVSFTGATDRSLMEEVTSRLAVERATAGQIPYVVPRGGASDVGALGFLAAAHELDLQADEIGDMPTAIVLPLGSGGSAAGLVAGLCTSRRDWHVHAVSVSRDPEAIEHDLVNKAIRCAALVGITLAPEDVTKRLSVHDGRAPGFGRVSPEQAALLDEAAAVSGLLIDPTYNAKTLYWLRDTDHYLPLRRMPVLYWHTGGALGAIDHIQSPRKAISP